MIQVTLGLFILVAYTIEAITGFGSIVIALALGALLLPIPELLLILVPLNILMSGYLTLRHYRSIDRRVLLRLILPMMVMGMVAGIWLQPYLTGLILKEAFGVLVIWFAGHALWSMHRKTPPKAHHPWLSRVVIICAGLTHGLFASGGPLLVYGLTGAKLDKTAFRATLIAVWFTLNSTLTLVYLFRGELLSSLGTSAPYIPLLVVGVLIGEKLHNRVDETSFRKLVYGLLVITGVLLLR